MQNQISILRLAAIVRSGANLLTIQRSGRVVFRILEVGTDVVAMSGLTIPNGSAPDANSGGISNDGTLNLINCTVSGNTGGAIRYAEFCL